MNIENPPEDIFKRAVPRSFGCLYFSDRPQRETPLPTAAKKTPAGKKARRQPKR
jgi:hypothetical protein